MALHTFINALNAGELSPLLSARTDSDKYRSGCKSLQNMIPLVQGGVRRRPGIETLAVIGQQAKLIGFNFSTTTSFVIEFTPGIARFWSYGALIPKLDASGPLQINTQFTQTNLKRLQACQLNDVIYLTDGAHQPQVLERYGDQDWRIRDIHQPKAGYADISGVYTIGAAGTADRQIWSVPYGTFSTFEAMLSYLISVPPTSTVANSAAPIGLVNTYVSCAQRVTAFFVPPSTGNYQFRGVNIDTWGRIRLNTTAGGSTVGAQNILECYINNGTQDATSGTYALTAGLSYFIEFTLEDWYWPNTGSFEYKVGAGAWTAITAGLLQKATPPVAPTQAELIQGWPAMLDTNAQDITLTPSGTAGQITITSTADVFKAGHANSYWQIAHYRDTARSTLGPVSGAGTGSVAANATSTPVRIVGTWDVFTYGRWSGVLLLQRRSLDSTVWETIRSWEASNAERNVAASGVENEECELQLKTVTGFSTFASSSDAFWTLEAADTRITGLVKITGYTNARSVSAYVVRSLGANTATKAWAEGAWSDVRGYPNAVAFYEQRLLFGGTTSNPQRIHASTIGDFENFLRGTYDDSALDFTLAAADGNPIQWMASQQGLIVGTSGDEWLIDSGSNEKPITPTNVRVKRQSRYGSATGLPALIVGEVALFVQRGARKVREFTYAFERDGWVAPDLSLLAEHITKTGIKTLAYQSIPESRLWCALNDGSLVGMVYERDQKIIAWHRHKACFPQDLTSGNNDTNGNAAKFHSIATIYGTDVDETWFCAQSPIDLLYYIGRLHPATAAGSTPQKYNDFFHTPTLTYAATTLAVCGTTNTAPTVTSATTGFVVGQTVSGTGIPAGAYITAVTDTGFTINTSATATNASVSLTFGVITAATCAINNLNAFVTTTLLGFMKGQTVSGTGIQAGSIITSITPGTGFAMNLQAAATNATAALTFGPVTQFAAAGTPSKWIVQPMPLAIDLRDGPNRGRTQRIARISVELIDSFVEVISSSGLYYCDNPDDVTVPTDYMPASNEDGNPAGPGPFTGDVDCVVESRHRRRTNFALSGQSAGQINISAIVAKWEAYGN